ncbi:hypothetical protein D3C80_2158480 [compost metagenome]
MAAVQDGDRQQVDDAQAQRQQGEELDEPIHATFGRNIGDPGNGDRAGNVLQRGFAGDDPAHHGQ